MKTRLWEVNFDDYERVTVKANNVKQAIGRAMIKRKGQYKNRVQDIIRVELLAEED